MAAIPILDCDGTKCVAFGEIDLADGAKGGVARSPDGDFRIDVVPIYVGKRLKGPMVVYGVVASKTLDAWRKVQGFRAAEIKGAVRR